jgi:hypothetical protein
MNELQCILQARPSIDPIDASFGMIRGDSLIVDRKGIIEVYLFNTDFNSEHIQCKLLLEGEIVFTINMSILNNGLKGSLAVNLLDLSPGWQPLCIRFEDRKNNRVVFETHREIYMLDRLEIRHGFNAKYTSLGYNGKISVAGSAKDWNTLWPSGPDKDVVVNFDGRGNLMFWRGTSYVPCWNKNNIIHTGAYCETVESPPYSDCCEPMMDRECRYSQVRIIASSPARTIIHWRYALSDFEYRICRNEWTDEQYVIYPQGIAVRNVFCRFDTNDKCTYHTIDEFGNKRPTTYLEEPMRFHNCTEFLVINPQSTTCEQNLSDDAMTIMDTGDYKLPLKWPEPQLEDGKLPPLNSYIFKVNSPDFSTFSSPYTGGVWADFRGPTGPVGWNEKEEKWNWNEIDVPAQYATCVHWPLTRAVGTRMLNKRSMFYEQPTHSWLGCAGSNPVSWLETGCKWLWLGGIVTSDSEVRNIVENWKDAPAIEVLSGGNYLGYKPEEMAHAISAESNKVDIQIKEKRQFSFLSFTIDNIKETDISVHINGNYFPRTYYKVGIETTDDIPRTILVFLHSVKGPFMLTLFLGESGKNE